LGDAAGNILSADAAVCDLLHRSASELIGLSFKQITHPDDLPNNVKALDALVVEAPPAMIRKRYLRPDGSSVQVDLAASRLTVGRETGRLVGTLFAVQPAAETTQRALLGAASALLGGWHRRRLWLGAEMGGDYPWLILLHAYLAEAQGGAIDIKGVVDRIDSSESVVRRWLAILVEQGLLELVGPSEYLQLTAEGYRKSELVLAG
jgi:PAS domain S-box-containing protein